MQRKVHLAAILAIAAAGVTRGQGLVGADCSNPDPSLPKYCCEGIMPAASMAQTCECNPGWTPEECTCKGYLTQMPCHHCMAHLPATNQWPKTFSIDELHANCESCVDRCQSEMNTGSCAAFMPYVWNREFPSGTAQEVLCSAGYLKSHLMSETYPIDMKRALYRSRKYRSDEDYHQPSDWDVAGVGK
mmetsp:Transcript_58321/g.107657  ORF Transcript_58321/g.107657 Transcript_58321/m.107657 type:complete len:188 (-) Transcript_58321:26-589(-)